MREKIKDWFESVKLYTNEKLSSNSDLKSLEQLVSYYNTLFTLILKVAMDRLDLCTSFDLGDTFYQLIIQEVSLIHFIFSQFGEQAIGVVAIFEYSLPFCLT